ARGGGGGGGKGRMEGWRRGVGVKRLDFGADETARGIGLEDAHRSVEIVRPEPIVFMKGDRVAAAPGGNRLKHVAHRAKAFGIAHVPDPRIAEAGRPRPVLVGRAVVEQDHLEVLQRLPEDRLQALPRVLELVIARDVDRDERRQDPVSHCCWITKSPSLTLATPCPVRKRSQRSIVNPMALLQESQRSTFHTPMLKLNAYAPSVSGSGPSRQTKC